MAGIRDYVRRIQVEFRPSRPLTKIVVIVAIVLSMAALTTLRLAQDRIEAQTNDMLAEAARLEQENQELQDKIDTMDTVEGVVDIAQEELGLVEPDTIIIKPE
jgi:cell division protein FtsB